MADVGIPLSEIKTEDGFSVAALSSPRDTTSRFRFWQCSIGCWMDLPRSHLPFLTRHGTDESDVFFLITLLSTSEQRTGN